MARVRTGRSSVGRYRWRPVGVTLALVLTVSLSACSGGSGGPTAPDSATATLLVEERLFQLLNDARTNDGLDALDLGEALSRVARRHSISMRDDDFFGHAGPQGGLRARLNGAQVEFSLAGENLARVSGGSDPAGLAHSRLMDSSGHRAEILDSRHTLVGVGVASRGDTYWVTQIFVRP